MTKNEFIQQLVLSLARSPHRNFHISTIPQLAIAIASSLEEKNVKFTPVYTKAIQDHDD